MSKVEAFTEVDAVAHPGGEVFVADFPFDLLRFGVNQLFQVIELKILVVTKFPEKIFGCDEAIVIFIKFQKGLPDRLIVV